MVKDRLKLLPMPGDAHDRSLGTALSEAFHLLELFSEKVTEQKALERLSALVSRPGTPTPTVSAKAVAAVGDALNSQKRFRDAWQEVKERMLTELRSHGISLSDLDLDKLPRATPTPPSPPYAAIETISKPVRQLSNGAQLLSGYIMNRNSYWAAVDLKVVIQMKDVNGKLVREESADLTDNVLRPGAQAYFELIVPLAGSYGVENVYPLVTWSWGRSATGRSQ